MRCVEGSSPVRAFGYRFAVRLGARGEVVSVSCQVLRRLTGFGRSERGDRLTAPKGSEPVPVLLTWTVDPIFNCRPLRAYSFWFVLVCMHPRPAGQPNQRPQSETVDSGGFEDPG